MSHYVRCDRCSIEDAVTGTLTLPPGWIKVLGSDLCEPCCGVVRDFIRFTPERAAALPVEPIPQEPAPAPSATGDKLFETAPEDSAGSPTVSEHASNGELVPKTATDGDPAGQTQPAPAECSTEERTKTRRTRKKLLGQDAILPDKRTAFPHGANQP